ncbi:MAG: hypothetical protein ACREK1_01130 [Longimicrobiales bacterium]
MFPRFHASTLLPLFLAGPAAAQTDTTRFDRLWGGEYDGPRRLELSASAGYAASTDWSDLVALHVTDARGGIHRQVLLRSVAVAPGAGGAASVTYWKGRHGFRVTAGYTQSCLTTAPRCVDGDPAPPEQNAALTVAEVPMDVWRYGVEGIVGLRNWADSRLWRPYAVLGLGGVAYDPEAGALPIFPGTFETVVPAPDGGSGTVVITNGTDTFLLATDELGLENVLGLTLGIGMDLRVPVGIGGLSLRLELADQMTRSPFSVRVTRLGDDRRRFDRDGGEAVFRSEVIHNLRASAGVALEFGLRGPREEFDPSIRRR